MCVCLFGILCGMLSVSRAPAFPLSERQRDIVMGEMQNYCNFIFPLKNNVQFIHFHHIISATFWGFW